MSKTRDPASAEIEVDTLEDTPKIGLVIGTSSLLPGLQVGGLSTNFLYGDH